MKIPGIARTCKEQTEYFLDRAKSYGIEIPEEKNSTSIGDIRKIRSCKATSVP